MIVKCFFLSLIFCSALYFFYIVFVYVCYEFMYVDFLYTIFLLRLCFIVVVVELHLLYLFLLCVYFGFFSFLAFFNNAWVFCLFVVLVCCCCCCIPVEYMQCYYCVVLSPSYACKFQMLNIQLGHQARWLAGWLAGSPQ